MFGKKKPEIKKWHGTIFLVIIGVAALVKLCGYHWPSANVVIAGAARRVLLADTVEHRYRGWSKRENMGENDGMLFVFPARGQHAMVMREMRFPLDIIWLDVSEENNGCLAGSFWRGLFYGVRPPCAAKIIDIASNLPPEIGRPEAMLTPYVPRADSVMVLEAPAGWAEEKGLKIGERVEIK